MNRYMRMPPQRSTPRTSCMPASPELVEPCLSLAVSYVMWQEWAHIYEPETAFCRGTIFQDLDLPSTPCGGGCK